MRRRKFESFFNEDETDSDLDTPQNRQNTLLQVFSNNSDGAVDLKGTDKD